MRYNLIPTTCLLWFTTAMVWGVFAQTVVMAAEIKLRAVLVWGTDDAKPPEGKNYKPVDAEIAKELKKLPLKWTNWFEVSRTNFAVAPGPAKRIAVSQKCELEVKVVENSELEVVLIGKGKEVVRRRQSLSRGETLSLGGNAPNSTAWLVLLKRLE